MTEIIQIVLSGFQVGCIYALIALGFSLVYRVTNVINLAQGAFCIVGALVGATAFVPGLSRLSNANMSAVCPNACLRRKNYSRPKRWSRLRFNTIVGDFRSSLRDKQQLRSSTCM